MQLPPHKTGESSQNAILFYQLPLEVYIVYTQSKGSV